MRDVEGTGWIGGTRRPGTGAQFEAWSPLDGQQLGPVFRTASDGDVAEAGDRAAAAFGPFRRTTPEQRAALLDDIATGIERERDVLVARARLETALPVPRLDGEVTRTASQLRLFATVLRRGDASAVRIDHGDPDRTPLPKPDVRMRRMGVGPVAVFAASNFPFAFSVAGGDTASALAAGCPVVVKAHESHPGLSELVGGIIVEAVERHGLPSGVFALLQGDGRVIGGPLVAHPAIAAVGFTGSRGAGLALMRIASERKRPIPVFAEMSSVNPVVILESALSDPRSLARDWVSSLTLGAGQFCTNPGIVYLSRGAAADAFIDEALSAVEQVEPAAMLSPGIAASYAKAREQRLGPDESGADSGSSRAVPGIEVADAADLSTLRVLREEVFGPFGAVVLVDDEAALARALADHEGELTVSVHAAPSDPFVAEVIEVAETIAGRIVFNAWPTGVEVCDAMVHGGPFPATSDSRFTSVGSMAIDRFLRPVAYQGLPEDMLPAELRDAG